MAANPQLVEEDQAHGRVEEIFGDIKRTMHMAVVGDVFRACAVQPPVLEAAWLGIKPFIGHPSFEGLADRIRAHAIACARQHFYVPDHSAALETRGFPKIEIDRIRQVVEMFHENDARLLVIAALVRDSLLSGSGSRPKAVQAAPRAAVGQLPKLNISVVSLGSLPTSQRQLLDEIDNALEYSFIPIDFRALAGWPQYVELAWQDLKAQVRSAAFRRHVQEIRAIVGAGVHSLPVQIDLGPAASEGIRRDQVAGVHRVVDNLARAMPDLVAAIALFRLGLNALMEDQLLELEAGAEN